MHARQLQPHTRGIRLFVENRAELDRRLAVFAHPVRQHHPQPEAGFDAQFQLWITGERAIGLFRKLQLTAITRGIRKGKQFRCAHFDLVRRLGPSVRLLGRRAGPGERQDNCRANNVTRHFSSLATPTAKAR